jgi:hypothetical protein
MSKSHSNDLDPKTASKATYSIDAARRAKLASASVPLHVLDAFGVDIPHREWNPEDAHEHPTTVTFDDGSKVHLHQDVRESMDDDFGSFDAIDDEDDDVVWTVVDLRWDEIVLKVVGEWSKRRDVPREEFTEKYEPIYLADGVPRMGY